MLAAYCKNEDSNCAKLLGTVTQTHEGGLISNNTSLISSNTALISSALANGGLDICSFYSEPTDAAILAFGELYSDFAYEGSGESCGSIAFSDSGESCGSIACSGGSSSFGGCSYSC